MPSKKDRNALVDAEFADRLLTTTRSVRKRLDLSRPVPAELIEECLEVAVQAPTATYSQRWRFVVITDANQRATLAQIYGDAFRQYWASGKAADYGTGPSAAQTKRMIDSAQYLVDHLKDVPVHVLFCVEGHPDRSSLFDLSNVFGTIMPAAWSFMLAARARGLGCCWTTVHLLDADKAAQALGLPDTVMQAALLPVAYYAGEDFQTAPRVPARELTWWNKWGQRRG